MICEVRCRVRSPSMVDQPRERGDLTRDSSQVDAPMVKTNDPQHWRERKKTIPAMGMRK